jgi:two-component system, LytTR family, sensor kinase
MTDRLTARERLLIFAFWTGLAILSAVNGLLNAPGFIRVMQPTGPVVLAFLEAWLWAAVTPMIFRLSASMPPERMRRGLRLLVLIAIGIALSITIYLIVDFTRDLIITPPRRGRHRSPLEEVARFRFINQFIFYVAVLAAGYARAYFLRDRQQQEQSTILKAQLAEAQLNALRMQINPHFLFNTLHAMSALVERDPAGVRKMIARLSELLRHTTDSSARDLIALRDELDFLRRYIEIMEIRFQGRLRVTIDVEDAALDALVPNLILQPIVENALEHGASRVAGMGEIEIRGRRDDRQLVLTVRDNGPGVDSSRGSGIGLANTRARLAQLYGDAARVELSSAGQGGAVAEIVIPYSCGDR